MNLLLSGPRGRLDSKGLVLSAGCLLVTEPTAAPQRCIAFVHPHTFAILPPLHDLLTAITQYLLANNVYSLASRHDPQAHTVKIKCYKYLLSCMAEFMMAGMSPNIVNALTAL